MKSKKTLNRSTLAAAANYLQPVSPTQGGYQADWYGEKYGKKIMNAQKEYLHKLKTNLQLVSNKAEIGQILQTLKVNWPSPPEDEPKFWMSDQGKLIITFWDNMIEKFVDEVNSLIQPIK